MEGDPESWLTNDILIQRDLSPSTTPDEQAQNDLTRSHSSVFDFPHLSGDGCVDELHSTPPRFQTPPAALSSLGARSKMDLPHSRSSESAVPMMDSDYDMVDDASDFHDDGETASIASTERRSEIDDSVVDISQEHGSDFSEADLRKTKLNRKSSADDSTLRKFMLEDSIEESVMSEDLETPRQSMFRAPTSQPSSQTALLSPKEKTTSVKRSHSTTSSARFKVSTTMVTSLCVITTLTAFFLMQLVNNLSADPMVQTSIRREALSSALMQLTNCNSTKMFDIEHLIPPATPVSTGFWGQKIYADDENVKYHAAAPNHIVYSLPKLSGRSNYPTVRLVEVTRDQQSIAHQQTRLIPGIYHIGLDLPEAHGLVTVSVLTKSPNLNTTFEHSFGNRMLHRQTYSQAGKELSRVVSQEVDVVQQNAFAFCSRVMDELSAVANATHNITTEIAVYMAKDLQVFVKDPLLALANAGNATAASIRQEVSNARKDLIRLGSDLKAVALHPNKSLVPFKNSLRRILINSRDNSAKMTHLVKRNIGDVTRGKSSEIGAYIQQAMGRLGGSKQIGSLTKSLTSISTSTAVQDLASSPHIVAGQDMASKADEHQPLGKEVIQQGRIETLT